MMPTSHGAPPDEHDPFAAGEIQVTAPLTPSMREVWLGSRLGGIEASLGYNEVLEMRFDGRLDADALERALALLLERHEALRGAFSADGEFFVVSSESPPALHRSQVQDEAELESHRAREVGEPFDLLNGPLYRAELVQVADDRHHLFLRVHHLVCDGWGFGVLLNELAVAYRAYAEGAQPDLPPAESIGKVIREEVEYQRTPEAQQNLQWWLEQLSPVESEIELPTDRSRPSVRSYSSRRIDHDLDADLVRSLRKLGSKNRCTFLVTLQAGFATLLHRLTGREDFLVGMPAAGQAAVGADNLVGHYVLMLPLRMQVEGSSSFEEVLARTKSFMVDALERRRVTFGELVKHLNRSRDAGRIPLIPVTFNLDPALPPLDFGPDVEMTWTSVPRRFDAFEIFMNAVDLKDTVRLECNYNCDIFDEGTIRRWLDTFGLLLRRLVEAPDQPLETLEVLTESDERVMQGLEDTEENFELEPTLVHRFDRQVAEHPDLTALEFRGETWSYARLDARVADLEAGLRSREVGPGSRVAVHLERGPDLVATLLAVMRVGAAYVPVDPKLPDSRKQMILEVAQPALVVSAEGGPAWSRSLDPDQVAATDVPRDVCRAQPHELAYVIFTSGSTGKPKGVALEHAGVASFLEAMRRLLDVSAEDRLLAITTVSFDISVLEIFLPLVSGAAVVLATEADGQDPEALRSILEGGQVSLFQATPATYRMLAESDWQPCPDVTALCGGEALPQDLAEIICKRVRKAYNVYGPTECTVWATVKALAPGAPVTLGKPLPNVTAQVVNRVGRRVPLGAVGELWLGGVQLARGYHDEPEMTADRFPIDAEGRKYRTGDLARVLPSGELAYVGRADFQVKVRGFRVELGEIETVLNQHPAVSESVLVAVPDPSGESSLAAYLVGRSERPSDADLAGFVQDRLPAYMVPTYFVWMDALPLTPSRKVDRKALPEPREAAAPRSFDAPETEFQQTLLSAWKTVLRRDDVGIHDDFFQVGGHSILALHAVKSMERSTGLKIPLGLMFEAPTVAKLEVALRRQGERASSLVLPLQPLGDSAPVYFLCGINLYRHLAEALAPDIPAFGVYVEQEQQLLEWAMQGRAGQVPVEELARSYVEAIKRHTPEGPYRLAGVSFGGLLALEAAILLEQEGDPVELVTMIDTIVPSGIRRNPLKYVAEQARTVRQEGVRAQLGKVRAKLQERIEKTTSRTADPDPESLSELSDAEISDLREKAYIQAMQAYRGHRRFKGRVLLVKAEDADWGPGIELLPDHGLSEFVDGALDLESAPGDHLGVIGPENAGRVGEFVRQRLAGRA